MKAETEATTGIKADAGRSQTAVASLLYATGKVDEALAAYRRAESLLTGLAGSDPEVRAALAACRTRMTRPLLHGGQPALALTAPKVAGIDGDGLLTMGEILALKLDADWVILSACNTGAGSGEGAEAASGLGRAFFYAGTRAVLVTNWSVHSQSARLLVTDVIRRQAQAGGHHLCGPWPAPETGTPMTYMVNGKQYIVLAIAGAGFGAELIAYKLPG